MNQNVSQNQMVDDCMVEMARDLLDADLVSQFGGHDKSIIVESEFEVILTHLPLWKNESPLFMIGRMLDNHMMKSLVKQEDVIDTIKSFLESESSVSDRPIVQYSWFLLKSGDKSFCVCRITYNEQYQMILDVEIKRLKTFLNLQEAWTHSDHGRSRIRQNHVKNCS